MVDFKKHQKNIEDICKALNVKRLGTFGSVNTNKFNKNSDIDLLVLFDEKDDTDLFSRYFELKEKLENLFGREVDIVTEKSLRNPYFIKSMEKSKNIIYEV